LRLYSAGIFSKNRDMKILTQILLISTVLLFNGCAFTFFGEKLEDRTTQPLFSAEKDLEVYAELDYPPGNIAVSSEGRVFFSFHPAGGAPVHIAELVSGNVVPYPDQVAQEEKFTSPLSLRIDRQNRLWVLDYGAYGFRRVKLYAFDLHSNQMVHEFQFPRNIAGFGSMLNDFQVDADGKKIYIADTSALAQNQAIIVYDVEKKKALRLLKKHPSVRNGAYAVHIHGKPLKMLGIFKPKFGVDSIALSRDGQWLYYAPLNGGVLYRIKVSAINNETLSEKELGEQVEKFADISMSDGITTDDAENIYIADMENAAIHRIDREGRLQTLFKDPRKLRWPDGFSLGPGGVLYFTDSALQDVIMKSARQIKRSRPYYIYRFHPGFPAAPRH